MARAVPAYCSNGRRRMEPFQVPVNDEKHLTFIKLHTPHLSRDCCISATDSAHPLGYVCLGIDFIWASRLLGRFGDFKKRRKLGRLQ
ncbi:UNVERIFIED_ORG: hypothetical protein M2193_000515 [Bradyrhizobium japonicum]